METSEIVLVLCQMALAVAGFSGITIAFIRTPGRLSELETYRLTWLFGTSFSALFVGLVPVVIGQFTVSETAAWRLGAGLMAGATLLLYAAQLSPSRRFLRETPTIFHRWILFGLALGHAANLGLQVTVAA